MEWYSGQNIMSLKTKIKTVFINFIILSTKINLIFEIIVIYLYTDQILLSN